MEFQPAVFQLAAFGFATVGTLSLPILLALSLAKSRRHWLFQSLPIFALAAPLIFVDAFDLMLIVLVAAFSVLTCSNIWHRQIERKLESENGSLGDSLDQPRFQLGLKDGFAAFVFLGVLAALLAQAIDAGVLTGDPGPVALVVLRCILIGGAIAAWGTFLLVLRVLKRRGSWILWLALLGLFAVVAGWYTWPVKVMMDTWRYTFATDLFFFSKPKGTSKFQSIFGWTILLALVALTVALITWLIRGRSAKQRNTKPTGMLGFQPTWIVRGKRMFASLWVLISLASIVYFYMVLLPPASYSPKRQLVSGTPNSFADLVTAGKALRTKGLGGYPLINPGPVLAGRIKLEKKLFEKIELALQAESCFSVDWSVAELDTDLASAGVIREIARALSSRALQALAEGRHDQVVADGLLCLKVADASAIDGSMIHSIVGTAIESIGISAAIPGVEGASVEQLKKAAVQLDEQIAFYGNVTEEMGRLVAADRHYARSSFLSHWLVTLQASFVDTTSAHDGVRAAIIRRNAMRQLFRTEVAIALYRLERGQIPDSLESLVPDFMDSVPNDQFSKDEGQPLRYVADKDEESYHLYSVGVDGVDDHGQVDKDNWRQTGDIDLKILDGNRLADVAQDVIEEAEAQARLEAELEDWDKKFEEDWELEIDEEMSKKASDQHETD